jgi:hypothetical protein
MTTLALALSASAVVAVGLQTVPARAGTTPGHHSAIVGQLGYEGGAPPGGLHPTAGTVEVEFKSAPLTLLKHVGKSGNFDIKLSPGSYTIIGCGPAAKGTTSSQCARPETIRLASGEVDHIQLIWAYVP